MPHTLIGLLLISMLFASAVIAQETPGASAHNRYTQTNFVANKSSYKPTLAVDKRFVDAWGISIRPKGAGGHFWVTAKDISYEYVGDVAQSANPKLRKMHQDELKIVKLPVGGDDKFATGTVFNGSDEHFVITQEIKGAKPITAPAKFLFASDGGVVSAWTERKNKGGKTEFPPVAITVIDQSAQGAQFFGLAMSHDYDTLYVADFGAAPAIKVFDGAFAPRNVHFDTPFDENENGIVDAGEFAPFNVQALTTPAGENHIFVTYAKTLSCPKTEVKKGTCKAGEIFAGEEDTSKPGYGRLAEFTEDGELVKIWADGGKLSAPWGLAFAPANFGKLSGTLLVSNFGDGTIAAFDADSTAFVDVLRNAKGKPVVIEKIWGLLFGNGESLGDSNALYFAAGPNDEKDGVFGSLRPSL
jgi:uncharacterized protein (TIGR03118 family)